MTTILLPAGCQHVSYIELAELMAKALNKGEDRQALAAYFFAKNDLPNEVKRGALLVRSGFNRALLPTAPMVDEYGDDSSIILLNDLRDFLKTRGISVEVEVEQPAQVARPAPAAQVEPVQAGPTEARRILKKRVMVDELLREWPTIENDLKESSRGTHKELKAANVSYGMWDVDAARAWAESRGKLVRVTAAESIDTAWAGGLIHRIRG